jgi:pyridoxine 5-phosphate synthase
MKNSRASGAKRDPPKPESTAMPLHIQYHIPVRPPDLDPVLLENRAGRLLELLSVSAGQVSIIFMDDREIASYNQRYRKRKGPTNVLSFPYDPTGADIPAEAAWEELGDILVSVETAEREARQKGKTLNDRLTELIIHGLCHLHGFDHERSEDEALRMRDMEQDLFRHVQFSGRNTMLHLAVNVDHVATVRQARGTNEPDPVIAAGICELAGAAGIVVHLREDRRHIQDRDVELLRRTVKTRLNLEMAATREMVDIALRIRPDMVTLVPEKRRELTTEGGLNVSGGRKKIGRAIEQLNGGGVPVSLFIDPDPKQIQAAAEISATFVELHTGRYCDAETRDEQSREFDLIRDSAAEAREAGLRVNAGHGLDYRNTQRIAALETIEELSIGHAIISRAVYVGLDQAVREMLALTKSPFGRR